MDEVVNTYANWLEKIANVTSESPPASTST